MKFALVMVELAGYMLLSVGIVLVSLIMAGLTINGLKAKRRK